jgi:hypothetical protein
MMPLRFHCTLGEYNRATLAQKRDWNRRFLTRAREGEERVLAAEYWNDHDEACEDLYR